MSPRFLLFPISSRMLSRCPGLHQTVFSLFSCNFFIFSWLLRFFNPAHLTRLITSHSLLFSVTTTSATSVFLRHYAHAFLPIFYYRQKLSGRLLPLTPDCLCRIASTSWHILRPVLKVIIPPVLFSQLCATASLFFLFPKLVLIYVIKFASLSYSLSYFRPSVPPIFSVLLCKLTFSYLLQQITPHPSHSLNPFRKFN